MTNLYQIPTLEPLSLVAGDTFEWIRDLSSFGQITPTDWTLSYSFIPVTTGNAPFSVTATDNGDGRFLVSVPPSTTSTYSADEYYWNAMVTSTTSTERHTLFSGQLVVKPNLATSGQQDLRSGIKKTLDAIEALLAGKFNADQHSVSVMGKSITKMSVQEVKDAHEYYKELYAAELRKENNGQNRPGPGKIYVRFGSDGQGWNPWRFL